MKRKYTKAYENYRRKFYAEKKIGNIKKKVHVLSQRQYRNARLGTNARGKRDPREAMSDAQILREQTILASKAEKRRVWKEYQEIRLSFNRGEALIQEGTYFGESREDIEGLSYHYNLSGLLKDGDALHFIISNRIEKGEGREEVLADYGY